MDAHVQLWKGVWPASIGLWTNCYPKYMAMHAPKQHVLDSANPMLLRMTDQMQQCN